MSKLQKDAAIVIAAPLAGLLFLWLAGVPVESDLFVAALAIYILYISLCAFMSILVRRKG